MNLTDKAPAQLANDAAELIRALNHKTFDKGAYETPPAAGEAAYGLKTLVERLPQALGQLETGLLELGSVGAIRMTDGTDPTRAVAECVSALAAARPLLSQLLDELAIVSARTSNMGAHWPDEEEDDEG
ncbi:hypothetical protein AB0B15_42955 [Streptomyces sp. NPDC045456]|uniref:hypothetical protein n=1 Tax=Streptomyces sp. NPDC045456 TaxID=3155254 RepID=UPI00340EA524